VSRRFATALYFSEYLGRIQFDDCGIKQIQHIRLVSAEEPTEIKALVESTHAAIVVPDAGRIGLAPMVA
jgi:hypothetical protein